MLQEWLEELAEDEMKKTASSQFEEVLRDMDIPELKAFYELSKEGQFTHEVPAGVELDPVRARRQGAIMGGVGLGTLGAMMGGAAGGPGGAILGGLGGGAVGALGGAGLGGYMSSQERNRILANRASLEQAGAMQSPQQKEAAKVALPEGVDPASEEAIRYQGRQSGANLGGIAGMLGGAGLGAGIGSRLPGVAAPIGMMLGGGGAGYALGRMAGGPLGERAAMAGGVPPKAPAPSPQQDVRLAMVDKGPEDFQAAYASPEVQAVKERLLAENPDMDEFTLNTHPEMDKAVMQAAGVQKRAALEEKFKMAAATGAALARAGFVPSVIEGHFKFAEMSEEDKDKVETVSEAMKETKDMSPEERKKFMKGVGKAVPGGEENGEEEEENGKENEEKTASFRSAVLSAAAKGAIHSYEWEL